MTTAVVPTVPASPDPARDPAQANRRMLRWIAIIPVVMLAIGLFVMKPLYTLWCNAQGGALNPNAPAVAAQAPIKTGRYVNVYWSSQVFDRLPITFRVDHDHERLQVGVEGSNVYRVKNLSDQTIRVRPVHQVSPVQATAKFGMRVCFCFKEQTLAPNEEKEFEIAYTFDPSLDERIQDVTLKYSLFEVKADGPSPEQLTIERETKQAIAADDDAVPGTVTGGATP